ncbi:GNAT family N-acetyltransferase [Cellulosimicrobium sp. I38E]|uniref:GNAT family N-acetyltransferase n=1 Tax=Cellulosimicrobium sp. I38E TaxID=1393139 RepID=UPI0007B1C16E|nr:GNAT family protein [Cellulosimicrobium sp. I38E]KZM79741.1 GNAT family acetyltransferase [Cellulosimicrobium sp. I38E]
MQHDTTLEGFGVRLVPLDESHAPALGALVDDGIWAGMSSRVPAGTDAMSGYVRDAVAAPGRLAFAVVGAGSGDASDGAEVVRGSTSLYEWVPSQGRVELGSTFYAREWWGGVTNPACKYLLLRHAFEDLGVARVALRADARNSRSIGAIRRLGAVPEGVLRSHRVAPDGSRQDTAYFSILLDEWATVRDGLLARLDALVGSAPTETVDNGSGRPVRR